MKLMKTLMAFGLAMTMTVSMSAVSYAQIPLSMMIASTAPITMQKNAYQLCLDQATVKNILHKHHRRFLCHSRKQ